MIAAVRWLFHEAHLVAEPSGAAAVAAALRAGVHGAVAVVSGGNVDPEASRRISRLDPVQPSARDVVRDFSRTSESAALPRRLPQRS